MTPLIKKFYEQDAEYVIVIVTKNDDCNARFYELLARLYAIYLFLDKASSTESISHSKMI